MAEQTLSDIMSVTMEKIKSMLDVNTIIGTPIQTPEGIMLIPVSKVSFGFGCGGSDFGPKSPANQVMFGGGSGAGANIVPIAFLVVNGTDVKILPVAPPPDTTVDRIVEMVPTMVDKVEGIFKKDKKKEQE